MEKYPEEFDIDMIRCIYCGMCEEVCPEQAIFLRKDYAITGFTREEMVHNKEKLIEIGGVMHGLVLKWNENEMKRAPTSCHPERSEGPRKRCSTLDENGNAGAGLRVLRRLKARPRPAGCVTGAAQDD